MHRFTLSLSLSLSLSALLCACELGVVDEEQSDVGGPYAQASVVTYECWLHAARAEKHWDKTDIPVYVTNNKEQGVQHSGHSIWDFSLSVQNAVSVWNEDSGTPLRLRYVGATTATKEDGAIVIRSESDGTCWRGAGTGLPEADLTTGVIKSAQVSITDCSHRVSGPANHVGNPGLLVDLLVHELGHALGRSDAYEPAYEACGEHTVMNTYDQSLTALDKQQHQSVYGTRVATPVVRAKPVGATWDYPEELPIRGALYRLNPSSSYDGLYNVLAYPRDVGDGTTDLLTNRLFYGSLHDIDDVASQSHDPVATAMGPDKEGILVYHREVADGWRYVCYRRTSDRGVSYGGEKCLKTTRRSGVSAAYEPVSRQFLVGYVNDVGNPAVRLVPVTETRFSRPFTRTLYGEYTADAPGIACAPTYSFDGDNCRIVWGDSTTYGQRVRWREFEILPGPSWMDGPTRSAWMPSDEAPAVAFFDNKFHLALITSNQYISRYDMSRFGTSWTWRERLNDTGYVSAPALLTERFCFYGCFEQMYVHWLRYDE